LTVYVRDQKSVPKGVVVFEKTQCMVDGVQVIAMGWSKAYKYDTFRKKFGRGIASKRAIKTREMIDTNPSQVAADGYVDIKFLNIPYIIKQNFSHYIEIAKDSFHINGNVIFVIPVIEKYVEMANPMLYAIANNKSVVDTRHSAIINKTRYFTLKS